MKRSFNKARGYTLLEMLIVLAIMSAMLAAFGAGFSAMSARGRQYREAQALVAALRAARADALAHSDIEDFEIDVANRSYGVAGAAKSRAEHAASMTFTGADSLMSDRAEIGVIRFYPDGSASGGRITLASSREINTIEVDWLTGRVNLARERPS